jgi:flagellar basal body rod protein FlgB
MNEQVLATDNITELLVKIIEFTQLRQKILIRNINSMHTPDFEPRDLAVEEFSKLMTIAIIEHDAHKRLVFCDGRHIKFGPRGSFVAAPIIDRETKKLIEKDPNEYLRGQINKLLENSLNQRIAMQLLKKKQAEEKCVRGYLN